MLVTIAGWAVAWVVSAAVLRGLVKNFRPQNPRNNWTTALAVTFAMSLIGAGGGYLAQSIGFESRTLPSASGRGNAGCRWCGGAGRQCLTVGCGRC